MDHKDKLGARAWVTGVPVRSPLAAPAVPGSWGGGGGTVASVSGEQARRPWLLLPHDQPVGTSGAMKNHWLLGRFGGGFYLKELARSSPNSQPSMSLEHPVQSLSASETISNLLEN